MSDKPKISEGNKIGLAALIASVGIPLAQLAVGYLQQYTTQQQNITAENEKRRLEITKLFLDNYIGKKTDVQIATIQIMKALDPAFFISIEEGLKETSHSDSVKMSIRRATIDAATEISDNTTSIRKSPKLRKVLSSNELESKGWELIKKGDKKNAQKYFDQANEAYPIYKNKPVTTTSIDDADMKKMQKQMDKELEKKMEKMKKSMEKQ